MTKKETKRIQRKTVQGTKPKYYTKRKHNNINKQKNVAKSVQGKNTGTRKVYKTKKGGGLFGSSSQQTIERKPEITSRDIAIKFLNIIRQGSVSSVKEFLIKPNTEYDIKPSEVLQVSEILSIVRSPNSFYNIYPLSESYYKDVIDKAKTYDLSKDKQPAQSKNTSTSAPKTDVATPAKTESGPMSYADFQASIKKGESTTQYLSENKQKAIKHQTAKLDDAIDKLYKYVQIAMYVKYKFIEYLQKKYSQHIKGDSSPSNNVKKLRESVNSRLSELSSKYSRSRSNQYFNSKYKKDIDTVIDILTAIYKEKYNCIITYGNMYANSISSDTQQYKIDTIFSVEKISLVVEAVNTLETEIKQLVH